MATSQSQNTAKGRMMRMKSETKTWKQEKNADAKAQGKQVENTNEEGNLNYCQATTEKLHAARHRQSNPPRSHQTMFQECGLVVNRQQVCRTPLHHCLPKHRSGTCHCLLGERAGLAWRKDSQKEGRSTQQTQRQRQPPRAHVRRSPAKPTSPMKWQCLSCKHAAARAARPQDLKQKHGYKGRSHPFGCQGSRYDTKH